MTENPGGGDVRRAGRGCMLVDVRVAVWAADEHDYDRLVLVVLPRLRDAYVDVNTTANWGAVGLADPVAQPYESRFALRVEAPHARAAAARTKEHIQQVMRVAGVRGVVSVLDGWPVS
jgi:hypothetical protein